MPAEVANFPTVNGAGQTIAVLDTGVDYTNPVFGRAGFGRAFKVRAGYNFIDNNTNFLDTVGHGTATAAMAAGNGWTYGGHHFQGVAPGAQIAALKVDDGSGNISTSEYVRALEWIIGYRYKYNITAVNISEGGDTTFAQKMAGTDYGGLLAQLKNMGVFIAISSGNDSVASGVEYPAADVSAIAVGSVNVNNTVSSFSDTGADLDLLAPGSNVAVPYVGETGGHVTLLASGTSFSSPIAAGAATLLKQISPSASVDDILVTLQNTGTQVTDSRNGFTFSSVNIDNAVSVTEAYLRRHRRHR